MEMRRREFLAMSLAGAGGILFGSGVRGRGSGAEAQGV